MTTKTSTTSEARTNGMPARLRVLNRRAERELALIRLERDQGKPHLARAHRRDLLSFIDAWRDEVAGLLVLDD